MVWTIRIGLTQRFSWYAEFRSQTIFSKSMFTDKHRYLFCTNRGKKIYINEIQFERLNESTCCDKNALANTNKGVDVCPTRFVAKELRKNVSIFIDNFKHPMLCEIIDIDSKYFLQRNSFFFLVCLLHIFVFADIQKKKKWEYLIVDKVINRSISNWFSIRMSCTICTSVQMLIQVITHRLCETDICFKWEWDCSCVLC